VRGLDPVQRLNARENAAGSENPNRYAVWLTETFFPFKYGQQLGSGLRFLRFSIISQTVTGSCAHSQVGRELKLRPFSAVKS
jgi:hypothetical protein